MLLPPTAQQSGQRARRLHCFGQSARLHFGGGTSTTVTVSVNGDITTEANETFFVNLSSVTNATAGDIRAREQSRMTT